LGGERRGGGTCLRGAGCDEIDEMEGGVFNGVFKKYFKANVGAVKRRGDDDGGEEAQRAHDVVAHPRGVSGGEGAGCFFVAVAVRAMKGTPCARRRLRRR
jgi:hypothetical protein